MTAMANQFQWIYLSRHFITIIICIIYIDWVHFDWRVYACVNTWKIRGDFFSQRSALSFCSGCLFPFLWLIKIHSVYINAKQRCLMNKNQWEINLVLWHRRHGLDLFWKWNVHIFISLTENRIRNSLTVDWFYCMWK